MGSSDLKVSGTFPLESERGSIIYTPSVSSLCCEKGEDQKQCYYSFSYGSFLPS